MRSTQLLIAATALFVGTSTVSAESALRSTIDDQTGVEVTVYNNNLGLVKDVRKLQLPSGTGELQFMDVASSIMPETVHVKSLTKPDALAILEQNYEYDLINQSKLLDKYIGKDITLIDRNEFQDREREVTATVLSNNDGPIYKIDGKIYLGHPGIRVLPELPQDLIARPTLTWMYANEAEDAHTVEVSYLTQNLTWKADYVLEVNAEDTGADLAGWVTVDNRSGAAYRNAKLKLIAGEVNRVQPDQGDYKHLMRQARMTVATMDMAEGFAEQAFFEYHIYDLERPTTVKDNQTKQINLLEASGIAVEKELVVEGQTSYFFQSFTNQDLKQPVQVKIKFKNEKNNRLGMPLPAGIMRLYKKDQAGSLQFVGEDRIVHTPKDEEVRLKIGEAFDVTAERKQTDYQQLSSKVRETEWELTLKNHKEQDVVVKVIEPMIGDWKVVRSSHPHEKIEAFKIRFDVPVKKDETVKITYRVRIES